MIIYEAEPGETEVGPCDVLHPFPAMLALDENDKKAVLSYTACEDAVAWMHHLVRYMLEGKLEPLLIHILARC